MMRFSKSSLPPSRRNHPYPHSMLCIPSEASQPSIKIPPRWGRTQYRRRYRSCPSDDARNNCEEWSSFLRKNIWRCGKNQNTKNVKGRVIVLNFNYQRKEWHVSTYHLYRKSQYWLLHLAEATSLLFYSIYFFNSKHLPWKFFQFASLALARWKSNFRSVERGDKLKPDSWLHPQISFVLKTLYLPNVKH